MSAAAGRRLESAEISLHSASSQSNSIAMAISMLNKSIINADSNGAVFMNGCPLLVENEKVKLGLRPRNF